MAPSFDNLTEDNGTYDSEEEIDFSGASTTALYKHARLTITQTSKSSMMYDSSKA